MCFSLLPNGKDWIDLLGALLTPTIAGLGIWVAYSQHVVNKNRLKSELFDKRYSVYEKIAAFISIVPIEGKVPEGKEFEFLRDTKTVKILFDDEIKKLTDEVYGKAIDLQCLASTIQDEKDHAKRAENLAEQRVIKEWFRNTLRGLEDKFIKFLKLEH